jgi:hypothetical protein
MAREIERVILSRVSAGRWNLNCCSKYEFSSDEQNNIKRMVTHSFVITMRVNQGLANNLSRMSPLQIPLDLPFKLEMMV